MDVGVRELKAHLSEILERAASGENVVVTDRGRPIVRLVAFNPASAVDRGVEEGWIEAPRRQALGPATRARGRSAVLDVLDEDRG
jgi:prevent-host-death family protein